MLVLILIVYTGPDRGIQLPTEMLPSSPGLRVLHTDVVTAPSPRLPDMHLADTLVIIINNKPVWTIKQGKGTPYWIEASGLDLSRVTR